ncbi:hypothetical protein D3C78_837180 [compost metagenome]
MAIAAWLARGITLSIAVAVIGFRFTGLSTIKIPTLVPWLIRGKTANSLILNCWANNRSASSFSSIPLICNGVPLSRVLYKKLGSSSGISNRSTRSLSSKSMDSSPSLFSIRSFKVYLLFVILFHVLYPSSAVIGPVPIIPLSLEPFSSINRMIALLKPRPYPAVTEVKIVLSSFCKFNVCCIEKLTSLKTFNCLAFSVSLLNQLSLSC